MKSVLRKIVGKALATWTQFERMKRCLGFGQTVTLWYKERWNAPGTVLEVRVINVKTTLCLRARSSDLEVLLKVFSDREYDLPLEKTPSTVLDGGANVGYATVCFAEKFSHAKIIAVEPDRSNLEILRRNTATLTNILVVEAALWSHDTEVELEDPGMAEHAFRVAGLNKKPGSLSQASHKRAVRALCLNSLAIEAGVEGFEFVKLDIEGAEKAVLRDPRWLLHCQVLVAELHDRFVAGCSKQFYLAVEQFDGDYLIGENTIAFRRGWISEKYIDEGYWAASSS